MNRYILKILTAVRVVKDNATNLPAVRITGFLVLSKNIVRFFRMGRSDSYQLDM
jgi:hypothetical protein